MESDCFEFNPEGYNTGEAWQVTALHMLFNIKQDLRRKYRMVAGINIIETIDIPVYSWTFNNISVQIIYVIDHKENAKQIFSDIRNAFPKAYTNDKMFVQI